MIKLIICYVNFYKFKLFTSVTLLCHERKKSKRFSRIADQTVNCAPSLKHSCFQVSVFILGYPEHCDYLRHPRHPRHPRNLTTLATLSTSPPSPPSPPRYFGHPLHTSHPLFCLHKLVSLTFYIESFRRVEWSY